MPPKRSRNKGKKTKREISPSKQEPEKENELHESKASKAVESSEQEDTADSLVPEVGEDTKGLSLSPVVASIIEEERDLLIRSPSEYREISREESPEQYDRHLSGIPLPVLVPFTKSGWTVKSMKTPENVEEAPERSEGYTVPRASTGSDISPKTLVQSTKSDGGDFSGISPSRSSDPADTFVRHGLSSNTTPDPTSQIMFYPTGGKSTLVTPARPSTYEPPVEGPEASYTTEDPTNFMKETIMMPDYSEGEGNVLQKDDNGGTSPRLIGGVHAPRILPEPMSLSKIFISSGMTFTPSKLNPSEEGRDVQKQEDSGSQEADQANVAEDQEIGGKQKAQEGEVEDKEKSMVMSAHDIPASRRWQQWKLANPESDIIQIIDSLIDETDQEKAEVAGIALLERGKTVALWRNYEKLKKMLEDSQEEGFIADYEFQNIEDLEKENKYLQEMRKESAENTRRLQFNDESKVLGLLENIDEKDREAVKLGEQLESSHRRISDCEKQIRTLRIDAIKATATKEELRARLKDAEETLKEAVSEKDRDSPNKNILLDPSMGPAPQEPYEQTTSQNYQYNVDIDKTQHRIDYVKNEDDLIKDMPLAKLMEMDNVIDDAKSENEEQQDHFDFERKELQAEITRLQEKVEQMRAALAEARIGNGMDHNAVEQLRIQEQYIDHIEKKAAKAEAKLEEEKKTTQILSARIEVQNSTISQLEQLEQRSIEATETISSQVEDNDFAGVADLRKITLKIGPESLQSENNKLKELLKVQRSETGERGDWQVIKHMIEYAIGEDEAAKNAPMSATNTPPLSPYLRRSRHPPSPLIQAKWAAGTERSPLASLPRLKIPPAEFAHSDVDSDISDMPDLAAVDTSTTMIYEPSEMADGFLISIDSIDLRIERIRLALRHLVAKRSLHGLEEEDCANVLAMTIEGLDMAQKLGYSRGIARTIFWLGIVHYYNRKNTDASTAFDQADKEEDLPAEEKVRGKGLEAQSSFRKGNWRFAG